jgi:hypothetical protein
MSGSNFAASGSAAEILCRRAVTEASAAVPEFLWITVKEKKHG